MVLCCTPTLALGGLVLGTALPAAATAAPPIPGYLHSAGTDTLTPVLSGVVDDSADMAVDGRIFLTDSSGTAIGGSPTATKISLSGVADWAYNNAYSNNDNGFHPDCTDFASRSLHFGGGDPETYETSVIAPPPGNHKDDHIWYGRWHGTYSSYSWGAAYHLAHHLNLVGSYWIKYWSNASRGDILFAHLGGSSFTGIDHAGVTTKMSNGMPFFSQHTPNQRNFPLTYWIKHSKAGTTIWIASPAEH